jgi:hypothetical protein
MATWRSVRQIEQQNHHIPCARPISIVREVRRQTINLTMHGKFLVKMVGLQERKKLRIDEVAGLAHESDPVSADYGDRTAIMRATV